MLRLDFYLVGVAVLSGVLGLGQVAVADPAEGEPFIPSAERGYQHLTQTPYLPSDFSESALDGLWQVWPQDLRAKAEGGSDEERREMTLERYGLTRLPKYEHVAFDPELARSGKLPAAAVYEAEGVLQYVRTEDEGKTKYAMNCFACHGGKVLGQVVPGAPNAAYMLESLTLDMQQTKLKQGEAWSRMDLGLLAIPLGKTRGTTNATIFGVALLALRDKHLNVVRKRSGVPLRHHDMDAPPWWNVKKKKYLYIDGLTQKNHRTLMQFMLDPENGPKKFEGWQNDFRDVMAYIESIEAPQWPFEVDKALAERGRVAFEQHCASCHGTYGAQETYPEKLVPIEVVGTDRARLDAIDNSGRERYADSWFTFYGVDQTRTEGTGYVAPPLDGIWASGPYFHNGSVPTLWHVLHADERPKQWLPQGEEYDRERLGLKVATPEELPKGATYHEQHLYFDTTKHGKSAAGHDFPEALNKEEKRAVLEYLKTL